jgi:hypothetical protein
VFLREGAAIPYYPEAVTRTDRMDDGRTAVLSADASFRGIGRTALGALCGLD